MAFDKARLETLRGKYGAGHGGELFDPKFRRVADRIFSASGTRVAPYAGLPTFLAAPYHAVDPARPDFADLQVAMVGVPMDLGVTNRPGSSFGPRAVRAIERIGPYNHVLDTAPVHELRVADIGDVPFASRYRLEQSHDDIERYVGAIVDAGVAPLSVGGDHSITHPILKAVGRAGPVGMIHIDAHCVYTNRQPSSAMRGFGVTPASFAIEVQMDKIAEIVGLDPWEIRFLNAYRNGDMRPHQKEVEDATLIEVMQAAAAMTGHELPEQLKAMSSWDKEVHHG